MIYSTLDINSSTTEQEIFDFVARHLSNQGCRSVQTYECGGSCAYRGDCETMCAVGCLLTDEEVTEDMEGRNVDDIALPERLAPFRDLLRQLQQDHDLLDGPWFEICNRLRSTAKVYGLSDAVLDTLSWKPAS